MYQVVESRCGRLPAARLLSARTLIVVTLVSAALTLPATVYAQDPKPQADAQKKDAQKKPDTGIHGETTTQDGSVLLPGVVITVLDPTSNLPVAETTSDGQGKFDLPIAKPGTYTVRAFLDGFAEFLEQSVVVASGGAQLTIDLSLAKLTAHVDVKGAASEVPLEAASTLTTSSGRALEVGPIQGDNFQALLPTLPGVVRSLDGHVSIKGATPTQSSVQIDAANVTDPSTGNLGFDLPNDAVDSVDVQSNPYAAEFGRFSSGVTMLNTTRGGNRWSFVPNGFIPRFYRAKDDWWNITGIRSFRPRFALGGPIVKDKVFLFENVLYRYFRTPVPDLPGDQNVRFSEVKTFTRVDAATSPRQNWNFTFATFPQQVDRANLSLFNQSDVASNFRQGGFNLSASQNVTLSDSTLLQSTAAVKQYNVRVLGNGTSDMFMTPDGNSGDYFNRQTRRSTTYQLVSSLTTTTRKGVGEHLIKLGADVLRVDYNGTSESSPVDVLRETGSMASRIVFGLPTQQQQSSTETALIAQDHWRLNDRVMVEFGGRMDHDGVLERLNFTPRVGGALGLQSDGRTILRGGIGLFYDRTPLNVGAFPSFESRTITNYDVDGAIVGGPVTYVNRWAGDMRTPYSRIWNVELDHRLNDQWSFKVNHLERAGHHEFIVNPEIQDGVPAIVLSTTGESRYEETEVGVRYAVSTKAETTISYVHSRDRADLNSFDLYFGNNRDPLIRANQFGPAPVDVPHRLLIRGSYELPWELRFDPLIDLHTGFPYSTLTQDQAQYVGGRNEAGRYPTFFSFDFSASRPLRIWKYKATVGVRLFDALDVFNPRDAWRILGSPNFGQFGNGVPRDFQTFVELGWK